MYLENYGKTVEDSKKAIELNPKNIKAYYRAAKAYSALGKHTDAMEICELGLKEEPNNKPIQEELKTAKDLLDAQRVRAYGNLNFRIYIYIHVGSYYRVWESSDNQIR